MGENELFEALGFHWDRDRAQAPVDSYTVAEALAAFDRGMAGHVWAAAALASGFHQVGIGSACNARKCLSLLGFLTC